MFLYNEKIFKRVFTHSGKHWYKNIKSIPLYFKLIDHLIKYGYDEYANWETFSWFIDVMKKILPNYKHYWSIPIITDYYTYDTPLNLTDEEYEKQLKKTWCDVIDKMLGLLDLMDENNELYKSDDYISPENWSKIEESKNKAKEEFFSLFSKYFYQFWD